MFSKILAASIVASLAPQALAGIFVTAPTASTTCQAGTPCNIAWNDDGTPPLLADIGACEIGLFVGSVQQQIEVQPIAPSIDVSKQATLQFTPDATVGQNSNQYFIRFTSLSLKQVDNPIFPVLGFSAKFTLAGMTGTFNSTELSDIAAGSTPVGSSTPGAPSLTPSAPGPSNPVNSTPAPSSPATPGPTKISGVPSGTNKPTSSGPKPSTTGGPNGATKLNGSVSFALVAVFAAALACAF